MEFSGYYKRYYIANRVLGGRSLHSL